MSSSRSSTVCFLVILVWFNFKFLIFWPCLCKKAFDVSASRSSPTCFLVLLMWSFAKFELRKISWIIIFLVLGKNFTCPLAGHPLLLFGSFSVVQFEIFIILTYVFVRKILTFLLAGPPPICLLVLLFWSFAKLELREIIFSLFQGKKFTCLLTGHPLFFFGSFGLVQWEILNILVYDFGCKCWRVC